MGSGHSKTAFVGIDHRPAAQSYMPCHLFGNSEIYGLGIRLSYYIQYFAVIVALAIGLRPNKLSSIRIGLAILSIALFIALCINATGPNTLVILDWYIVVALIAAYLLASDYSNTPYLSKFWIRSRRGWSQRAARSKIKKLVARGGSTDRDAHHAVAFLDAARVVYRDSLAHRDLHRPLDAYSAAAAPASEGVRNRAAQMAASSANDTFVLDPKPFDADVVQGATDFHMTQAAAVEAQKAVYKLAQRDAAILLDEDELRERKRSGNLGSDRLIAGIVCLSWAMYQCVKPWLYFVAVNRGARRQFNCDVKVFWFFIPISIYREGFITFLKITSVISVIIAAVVAVWGLYLLATSLFNLRAWRAEPTYSRLESQRLSRASTASSRVRDGDGEHSDSSSDRSAKKVKKNLSPKKRAKRERKFYRWVALVLAVVLAITIGVVEGTIAINHLDMSHPVLGSTAEIIAFLVALLTSIPVLWECLVIVPLRLLTGRHKEPDFDMQEKPRRQREQPVMSPAGRNP